MGEEGATWDGQDTRGKRVCLCLCGVPRGDGRGIAEVNECDWLMRVFLLLLQFDYTRRPFFFFSSSYFTKFGFIKV